MGVRSLSLRRKESKKNRKRVKKTVPGGVKLSDQTILRPLALLCPEFLFLPVKFKKIVIEYMKDWEERCHERREGK